MNENFNKHLGNKLKLRRLALGLTQTKVAKANKLTIERAKQKTIDGWQRPTKNKGK